MSGTVTRRNPARRTRGARWYFAANVDLGPARGRKYSGRVFGGTVSSLEIRQDVKKESCSLHMLMMPLRRESDHTQAASQSLLRHIGSCGE